MTIAPRAGIIEGANGASAVGYGVIVSYFVPQSKTRDLQQATDWWNGLTEKARTGIAAGVGGGLALIGAVLYLRMLNGARAAIADRLGAAA